VSRTLPLLACALLFLACGSCPEPAQYQTPRAENPDEIDRDGLVLLRKSVTSQNGEVTGTVVNRRGVRLERVQITFNLYDASGARVGAASASVTGLGEGERWNFRAVAFTDFDSWKFSDLSGY
jgi:hypothetical protein